MLKHLSDINISPEGGFSGPGPLSRQLNQPLARFENIVSTVIGVMTVIAGIWFVFILLSGAIGIIGSGGDKAAYENARKRISTGLVGLVIVVIAVFIADFVGYLIGFDVLDVNQTVNRFLGN